MISKGPAVLPDQLSTVSGYVDAIASTWRASVSNIIETGRLLIAFKEAFPHGEYENAVRERLPFGETTALRLMALARSPLANPAHGKDLPASWTTLYELSRLPAERLTAALDAGEITPETTRLANGIVKSSISKCSMMECGSVGTRDLLRAEIEREIACSCGFAGPILESDRAFHTALEWLDAET